VYQKCSTFGCDALRPGRSVTTFRGTVLHPFSRRSTEEDVEVSNLDDGGSPFLRNTDELMDDYTASYTTSYFLHTYCRENFISHEAVNIKVQKFQRQNIQ
jgi:hypothetical protein